jgi:hypothetical protein
VSAALEDQYRRQNLRHDTIRAVLVFVVALVPLVLFAVSDYRLFGAASMFFWLLVGRTASVLYTLLTLALLLKRPAPHILDGAVLSWGLAAAVLNVCVNLTRPADYTGHFIIDVVYVVLFYVVLPVPLPCQAAPALLVSVASVALFVAVKQPVDGLTGTALAVAYLLANVLGGLSSWELHRWKRRQFTALRQEASLRAELEMALGEVKTLRGLLAICAHCKRVRDDKGAWWRVEAYVSARTHARFSHSICPGCMKEFYGMEPTSPFG